MDALRFMYPKCNEKQCLFLRCRVSGAVFQSYTEAIGALQRAANAWGPQCRANLSLIKLR